VLDVYVGENFSIIVSVLKRACVWPSFVVCCNLTVGHVENFILLKVSFLLGSLSSKLGTEGRNT
jgi:hypothetical protein